MKIALIGATGYVGSAVNEALERGHELTEIARNTSKRGLEHEKLFLVY